VWNLLLQLFARVRLYVYTSDAFILVQVCGLDHLIDSSKSATLNFIYLSIYQYISQLYLAAHNLKTLSEASADPDADGDPAHSRPPVTWPLADLLRVLTHCLYVLHTTSSFTTSSWPQPSPSVAPALASSSNSAAVPDPATVVDAWLWRPRPALPLVLAYTFGATSAQIEQVQAGVANWQSLALAATQVLAACDDAVRVAQLR
jgi:hypothetical protein